MTHTFIPKIICTTLFLTSIKNNTITIFIRILPTGYTAQMRFLVHRMPVHLDN